MFTTSSWIDEELYQELEPYLNLGIGYTVVFARQAVIPVRSFSAQCVVSFNGGLNLIEAFILRAAATFSPSVEDFIHLTALDDDVARGLIASMIGRGLLQNNQNALRVTEHGLQVFRQMQNENHRIRVIHGYQDVLTGKIKLLPSDHAALPLFDDGMNLLAVEVVRTSSVLAPEELQQIFQNQTNGDPYYGYKLMSVENIQIQEEMHGISVGLVLIYDVRTGSLNVKVFDLTEKRFNIEYERYFDANHIAEVTELVIEENYGEDIQDSNDWFHSLRRLAEEQYKRYLEEVESVRSLEDKHNIEVKTKIELIFDHKIKPRFLESIATAREEILILSPWVKASAMETLVEPLKQAVKRGVRIIIGWGIDTEITSEIRESNQRWMKLFEDAKLPSGLPGVYFIWIGNHHRKEVIVDQKHYLIGSYNWLSYRGEPMKNKKIRGESVLLVHDNAVANMARSCFNELVASALDREWKYYLSNLSCKEVRDICISLWFHLGMEERALEAIKKLARDAQAVQQGLFEQTMEVMQGIAEACGSTTFKGLDHIFDL